MKYYPLALLAVAAAVTAVLAQSPAPTTVATPVRVVPPTPPAPVVAAPAPVAVVVAPAATPGPAIVPATPVPGQRTASGAVPASTGVLLNFKNASLNDVLTYLSEAAGFVIVQEAPVTGTVNIVSRQPLNPEEAVDLLNTVLIEKGYAAIRNGRILKIVNRREAQKRDLPVQSGSDPELIPRKDSVVTQILPLRYGEAAKLVENLRPLLADTATISANDGSNAILLTDTQTNIRRMAQIIKALDTSVSSLSSITVIPLKFADSKSVADIITKLFAPTPTQGAGGAGGPQGGRRGFPGFGFGGGAGGPGAAGGAAASEARAAASRVVAVADEQSNSVVIASPEETVATIREMINQIDTSSVDVTDTKIYRLNNADAVELAGTINSLFGNAAGTLSSGGAARAGAVGAKAGAGAVRTAAPAGGAAGAGAGQSQRALLQSQVVAVGDPRTNSLLVTAAQDTMEKVDEIVLRLDSTTAKRQHVYTHSLQHADPDTVANVLRGMLGQQTTGTTTNTRLQDRSQNGSTLNTDTTTTGSGSGRR